MSGSTHSGERAADGRIRMNRGHRSTRPVFGNTVCCTLPLWSARALPPVPASIAKPKCCAVFANRMAASVAALAEQLGRHADGLYYHLRVLCRAALAKYAHGLLQVAKRDFTRALESPDVVVSGERRQLWAARNKGWVSEAELEELNRLLERLCTLATRPRAPGRDTLTSLAFVLAPLPRRARRRGQDG